MTKKRIAVVNDQPEFLSLMSDFLGDEGYDVIPLPKHQGAFTQIKEAKPDLIICDLIFGGETVGWALVDMLYLDPETRTIPLIVCSAASKLVQEAQPSLSAKGIGWLEKPFELEKLLEVMAAFLARTAPETKVRASDEQADKEQKKK